MGCWCLSPNSLQGTSLLQYQCCSQGSWLSTRERHCMRAQAALAKKPQCQIPKYSWVCSETKPLVDALRRNPNVWSMCSPGTNLLWYLCLQTVSGDQDSNHTWGKMLTWHHFPQMDPAYRRGPSFRREKTRVGHAWVPWLSGNKPSTLHPFSCNCLIDFVRHKLTPISPFCVWGNWGSESTTNLHKVI